MAVQPALNIRLLGDFSVTAGDEPVTSLNTPRLQALLTYLLLHRDAPQSRQRIAFLFWPDSTEDQALANLRNLLFVLRRSLPVSTQYLKADRNVLQWQAEGAVEIDVLQFEHALAEAEQAARSGDIGSHSACLQRATDLYRGDLLPSAYDDWILDERERLQQRFTTALESLIGLFEREQNPQGAIDACQRLLRHNPLHEATYKRLMELYAASDMVPEALRAYHSCSTILERELGVEPSANTREVYERLLNSRQTSRTPSTRPAVAPAPASQAPLKVGVPLVGRATEWGLLQEAWRSTEINDERGQASAVLIRGEAGIGKTKLVEELFNWVARQGTTAASARCYPIERQLAFGPAADWLQTLPIPSLPPVWLSEVARLRPAIAAEFPGVPAPGPLTEAWQRRRFMEAISRVLLGNQPLLLTLDDLQWCDSDTLQYLHFLMRYDLSARLLLVMTARTEELGAVPDPDRAQSLAHLLDSLRDTDQLLEIDLAPLGRDDTGQLAGELSGGQALDSPRIAELYRETEGNPLFIVEMLRTGWLHQTAPESAEKEIAPANAGATTGLPPRIARVLKTRLAQLSPGARSLVDFAAVIGRDFTLPLLQLASNESESAVVSGLDELWRRRIVREQGQDGYDFSHDKLRQAAYSGLTAARRRMLHARVARALEAAHAGRLDPVYAQLGTHYEMAGDHPAAAHYYQRAAEGARQLYANQEAIALYGRAFALALDTVPGRPANPDYGGQDPHGYVVELGESLGDLLENTGNHTRARSIYEKALAYCPESCPLCEARFLLKIGDTWRSQRQFDKAIGLYDAFDKLVGDRPREPERDWWGLRIESTVARLMVHYWQSEPVEMQRIAEKMQPAVEQHGSRLQKVKYHRCLANMHLRLSHYAATDECLRHITAALEETRELNNLSELVDTTFLMGFCLLWRYPIWPLDNTLPSAVDHLQQALSLTERTGQTDYRLLSLVYLTIAYRMQGDVERTRETIARHVELMHSVQMPSYSEAAEANMAWVAWKEGDLEAARRHGLAALPKFGQGESFVWLVTWPLAALSLAEGNLADAVQFAAAQLAPHIQQAPDALIAAVNGAVEAWDAGHIDQTATHLHNSLRFAHGCGYI